MKYKLLLILLGDLLTDQNLHCIGHIPIGIFKSSPTELRTTELLTTQLRTTQLRNTQLLRTELRTTELRKTQLRTTELRTTELREGPNFERLNLE